MGEGAEKYSRKGVKTSYISTVIGISLVLFVIGLVIAAVLGLDRVQTQSKESLVCDLFFEADLNEADIKQVEQELKTWDEFREVYFVSPDRALETFQEPGQDAEAILAVFGDENPMPPTISFKPKEEHANSEGLEAIRTKLMAGYGDRIEEMNYDKSMVKNVNLGFKQLVWLIGAVALLLIIVAFAMMNNTIRLALYSKRFSIKTMQLVGARSGYIRRPFLWQSIGMGLISAILGMSMVLLVIYAVNNLVDSVDVSMDIFHFLVLLGALLIIGIVISFVSTWLALNKYLRMKLDDLY
ncbi:MAG: permease-like cell division protein FtsX [Crocinitomicaceae bacterium]|nr:permease-like cell division protein FtsX [Crocinitomicaceae bacterium]